MLPDCKEATFLESYIKLLGMLTIFLFSYNMTNYFYTNFIYTELEWQMAIKQKTDDEELPLNSSIRESLHYASKHHYNTPNTFVVISPAMLCRNHDISPRLYQKVALQVKAVHGEWDDIDRLLITKVIYFVL